MQIVYQRVAAIDVGKKVVAVAVRTPGEPGGSRRQQVRKFRTFYPVLAQMVAWLVTEQVTHVTMEATGMYWKPVFHALCESGHPFEVLLVNARHVKTCPAAKVTCSTRPGWPSAGYCAAASSRHHRSPRSGT